MNGRSTTDKNEELIATKIVVIDSRSLPRGEATLTVRWRGFQGYRFKTITARLSASGDAAKAVLRTQDGTTAWILTTTLSKTKMDGDGFLIGRLHGYIPEQKKH